MILDTIKARIKAAMLAKNDAERNILRVLLGEAQTFEARLGTSPGTTASISDEQVVKIAKKMIDNNNETIASLDIGKPVIIKEDTSRYNIKMYPKGTNGKMTTWDTVLLGNGDIVHFVGSDLETPNEELRRTVEVLPHADNVRQAVLVGENVILESLVPKELTAQDIEAFFLDSDNPEFEQIQDAKSEGQAIGIAMKVLKAAKLVVDGKIVSQVVKKIRGM